MNKTIYCKRALENGNQTWEPLSSIEDEDPVTVKVYAKKDGSLETGGWKRLKSVPVLEDYTTTTAVGDESYVYCSYCTVYCIIVQKIVVF